MGSVETVKSVREHLTSERWERDVPSLSTLSSSLVIIEESRVKPVTPVAANASTCSAESGSRQLSIVTALRLWFERRERSRLQSSLQDSRTLPSIIMKIMYSPALKVLEELFTKT